MLKALKQRRENDEQGFTLIELMVVVLIIAILLAIAIPTFLGAQNRAKDRAAQSDLRNALTAAKTLATDQEGYFRKATSGGNYEGINGTVDLEGAESALTFVDTASGATVDAVGVTVVTDGPATLTAEPNMGQEILLVKISKAKGNPAFAIYAHQNGTVGHCKANNITDGSGSNASALATALGATLSNCAGSSFGNATDVA